MEKDCALPREVLHTASSADIISKPEFPGKAQESCFLIDVLQCYEQNFPTGKCHLWLIVCQMAWLLLTTHIRRSLRIISYRLILFLGNSELNIVVLCPQSSASVCRQGMGFSDTQYFFSDFPLDYPLHHLLVECLLNSSLIISLYNPAKCIFYTSLKHILKLYSVTHFLRKYSCYICACSSSYTETKHKYMS